MRQSRAALILLILSIFHINAQEESKEKDYIEFNDRKNIVHGVYLGINTSYGEIDGKDTGIFGLKVAYVANRQFEVGFSMKGFYSQQNLRGTFISNNEDLAGGYGGIHLEPIFFSKSRLNLSFPLLVGAGATGYVDGDFDNDDEFNEDEYEWDAIFVVEPGVSLLFNISRYVQLETGVKYRFSSKFDLVPNGVDRINGFSAGLGIKVGVFNLGRNRYKKNIPNNE
ncbi:hypothetical protein [Aquimarina sp. MMG016]|uniref:hypothetical protein n=1 Tax=Aquimarina sp. MMG016 TaxID=2822690 RepID=UPI001B39D13C|nr:hypothetical protein [Aquimarina sp. MMG016]MBQ4821211.1 hypothetical protein [Aquimarina sp. MMG016]